MNCFITDVHHNSIYLLCKFPVSNTQWHVWKFPFLFIFPAIEEVEATRSYYEKMSEELEKIVHEVKNSPIEENKTFTDSVQTTALASEYCIVQLYCV